MCRQSRDPDAGGPVFSSGCESFHEAQQRYDRPSYHFYGTVDARGGTFGDSFRDRCGADRGWRRTSGALGEAEVRATVSNYVRPYGFDQAAERLRREHVVLIEGPAGSGRRAGAVELLRDVTDGPLVVLPRAVTMRDLVNWDYRAGHGYAVLDGDGAGVGPDGLSWAEVARRVRGAGAHLVATTTTVTGHGAIRCVPHVSWVRPPPADVLRGHLADSCSAVDAAELADSLAPHLPADRTLSWIARLAELINAGSDPAQALRQVDEAPDEIRSWFTRRRTSRELAEVAASVFLAGVDEHTFGSQLGRLERRLAAHAPLAPAQPVAVPRTSRVPAFRERAQQRVVVSCLRETCETWFWDEVCDWINDMVREDDRLEVASGLAWLASTSFDEVEDTFLDPWSQRRLGWSGQVTAAYVLWCMCREERTAALALRTATRWSSSGDAHQRATAVIAFSGELGVCYPTEAVRRLWQLMSEADLLAAGCAAVGRLFAVLVDQGQPAEVVLGMLDHRRSQPCLAVAGSRLPGMTTAAVLAILTVQSHRTGRPAIAEFLQARPDRSAVAAALWAELLRQRPVHRPGLLALWRVLHSIGDRGAGALATARVLGRAISGALPGPDRLRLGADLAGLDRELRQGRSSPPAGVLSAFMESLDGRVTAGSGPPYGSEL